MGLIYSDYSVFGTGAQTIVNTVNCVGVMGAGVALEFKLRYPMMFKDYLRRCKNNEVKIGSPYLFKSNNRWILNFPTKSHWKNDSKLEWIIAGLNYFKNNYDREGITSIAFPKLGANKGGLIWRDVNKIMKEYLHEIDIPTYICLDKKPDAIESKMIGHLNNKTINELIETNVRKDIAKKIIRNSPLRRFRELLSIPGVGKKTYELLHQQSYREVKCGYTNKIKERNQQTFLDPY